MSEPNKLIRIIRMTMENTKSQVRIQSDLSDPVTTKKGLRQGDPLAFQLSIGKGSKGCRNTDKWNYILQVSIISVSSAYADDTDIIARSPTALKEAFLSLERAAGVMGLKINEKKLNI